MNQTATRWAVRRINFESVPFALIDPDSPCGDVILVDGISDGFAPVLAKCVGAVLQGQA